MLPVSPRPFVHAKLPGGLLDRLAHFPALGQQSLGQVSGLREGVITQESHHGRDETHRGCGFVLFPVMDRRWIDAELF